MLRNSLAGDDTYVRRFHNEAQAAASLVHANIVQIYEVGCIDGVHFIAQEYVQGQNLRELMVRNGPPALKQAVSVIRQVAAALHRAAERGIVHRDIKPENIMITRDGEVKVADFGLARITRDGAAVNLTQVGITMGTPLYMSPEQVEGKTIDHRSDLYSLGVTCYHMFAGVPPFRGETPLTVAVQHLKAQAERLENIRPDLPTALCRIVHKMLEKDPAHRYNSARELMRDLREVKIDDDDADWGDDKELWASLDEELAGRIDATLRLDTLMKTAALELGNHRPGRSLVLAVLGVGLALVLGAAAALATRPPSLLVDADPTQTNVPRKDTARDQFMFAGLTNSEERWMAVLQHYPKDEFYVRKTQMELALIRLSENDFDAALQYFNVFANMEDVEQSFRAFGLAGQCVVYSAQQKHRESLDKFEEFQDLLDEQPDTEARPRLLDLRMRRLLGFAVEASAGVLDRESEAKLLQTLKEALGTDR